MKSTSIDIKTLTSELRNISKDKSEPGKKKVDGSDIDLYLDRSKITAIETQENATLSELKSGNSFIEIINKINAKDQYNIDKFIYVDSDIHEVFTKLKLHTKLKLSTLVSHLLEEFFMEHKESIKEILSQKQNKFLN